MGRYFDFEPVKPWGGGLGVVGDALSTIGDTIDKRKSERVKEELERQKTAAYKAQVDAQVEGVKRQGLRDQVAFDQTQQDRMETASQKIANLVSGGRYGEAAAVSAGSRFLDPRSGKMAGIGFEKQGPGAAPTAPSQPGAEPVAPEAPVLPSQNEQDYYKVVSPEAARAQAIARSLGQSVPTLPSQNPADYQPPTAGSGRDLEAQAAGAQAAGTAVRAEDARGQYAADKMTHDIEMRAYDPAFQAYQAEKKSFDERSARPGVVLTYPNGSKVPIDPRESDQFKETQARDTASKLLQAADRETDPGRATTMRQQASMILAQLPSINQGALNNAASQETANKAKSEAQDKQITSTEKVAAGHDRARIAAAALGRGSGGGPGDKAWEKEDAALRAELDNFERNENLAGPKGLQQNQTALKQAYVEASKADQNPGQQILILDRLLRSASGLGVRQQMLQTYLNHLGGLKARGEGQMQAWSNGAIGKQQWANVKAAIGDELSNSMAAGGESNARFQDMAKKSSAYARHPDLVKRREAQMYSGLAGYGGKQSETAAPAPAAAAKPAAEHAVGERKQVNGKWFVKTGPNKWEPE